MTNEGSQALIPAGVLQEAALTLFRSDEPSYIVQKATAIADALMPIIEKRTLYTMINGRKHVRIEGWAFLGSLVPIGVYAIPIWSRPTDKGWEARAEARTFSGELVGAAEASCDRDEDNWTTKPDYALRSMAQTRAASKALRLPLAFIMVLAGYEATPAEEMDAIVVKPHPMGTVSTVAKSASPPRQRPIRPDQRLLAAVKESGYTGGLEAFLRAEAPDLITENGNYAVGKVTAKRADELITLVTELMRLANSGAAEGPDVPQVEPGDQLPFE